jgi:hypothetical protein
MDSQERDPETIKRLQDETTIKELAPFVKPVRQLYKCEVCGHKWMKWFFVTKFFRGFPKVRFCGKECRSKRHEKKTASSY